MATLNPKQMAKLALRLVPLALFAPVGIAACSSSDPATADGSAGRTNGNPGTAGNNPGAAGNGNPGAAGNTNPGTGGAAGATGIPGGGSSGTGTGFAGAGGLSAAAGGPTGSAGTTGSAGSTGSAGGGNTTGGAGYWTSKDWHGCSWTGKGVDGVTTVTPQDFTTKAANAPYCISGTVGAEPAYKSVALLGFNVNEPATASCVYKPVDTTSSGPPSVTPTADGIALNFVKQGTDTSFTLRVQIQGPNGAKDGAAGAADRWCATITEVSGKVFVPWSSFTPSCWETTAALKGTPYAKQPISAVVFTVPGKLTDTPYNFCINGFTYGSTAADAPDGTATQGDQTGTIGGPGGTDLDFARAKISVDGHSYIIQNNNWGSPEGSNQTLTYKNNSFKITATTGSGQSAPASFPSIYIGNNGNTANGVFSTKGNDNLPIQISAITSITSTFRYSPAITSSAINATYDIWFANSIPTGEYKDGINGFVMIWLRAPKDKHPIGYENGVAGTETIAGQTWNVYKGPRGAGPAGNNNAPVISFVNPADDNSRAQNFVNVDIKKFIDAATASKYGLPSNAYLTDVFAGFEIWDGGASSNLSVDEFKCVVNK